MFKKIQDEVMAAQKKGWFSHFFLGFGDLSVPDFFTFQVNTEKEKYFDLASLTKPLVTAPLVFREVGLFSLQKNQTISDFLQEKRHVLSESLQDLSILSLLEHRSGLPAWKNLWIRQKDSGEGFFDYTPQRLAALFDEILPSERKDFCYSDLGYILLGLLLELKTKKRLDKLFVEYLEESKLSQDIFFTKKEIEKSFFVSSGYCPVRQQETKGLVHDENCASLGGVSGHAGLFATGEAVILLLKKIRTSAFGEALLDEFYKRPRESILGWRLGREASNFSFLEESLGHFGFTGTSFWFCPHTNRYVVLLFNRTIKERVSPWVMEFRAKIHRLAHQAMDF